mgnify:CR=1 FL=1
MSNRDRLVVAMLAWLVGASAGDVLAQDWP